MLGTEYTTNHGAPWSTLWVMELRVADLTKEMYRSSLLEFAGQVAVPCVREALRVVLVPKDECDSQELTS
jgi:hypothetical protein